MSKPESVSSRIASFEWNRFWLGVQRMILGFFKKIIIADQLAVYVNGVYGAPHNYGTVSLVVATVFFAWQIYCDFSGYCDIAIGAAQVLGFSLSENFQAPYTSATISEFWRRWHISLSNWFRDYVYIPLGGSRGSEFATARNLFLTFLLSGLWHGANWTYVVWGAVNGVYLIIGRLLHRVTAASFTAKQLLPFAILRTFILTSFAWIFFRASSLAQAGQVIEGIVYRWDGFDWRNFLLGQTSTQLAVVVISIAVLFGLEYLGRDSKKSNQFLEKKLWLRSAVYLSVLFLMMALWRGVGSEFIYFQF
jgi:D-alanyl-lipoteichoic acid acyltransferase DltB (MBOAT superfamily)